MGMRETTREEIEEFAKVLHRGPPEYPQAIDDLPDAVQTHLRKTAYVFLTGDFLFEKDMRDLLQSSTPPRDGVE